MHDIYLKMKITLEGENSPSIGIANHNIGIAYLELEQYDKAEVHLNKTLVNFKLHYDEDSVSFAQALNSIANINSDMKRYSWALEQYGSVLRTFKMHNHKQGVAMVLNNIANVHLHTGAVSEAKADYEQVLQMEQ